MSDEIGHADDAQGAAIEDYLAELRTFPPPEDFARSALVRDRTLYEQADARSRGILGRAGEALTWFEPLEQVLDWHLPFAKWFVGGGLNVSFNCLDRHVEAGKGEKVAFHFEGEPGDPRTHHLRGAARRGLPVRQRAAQARHQAWRPRRHLHADDPRAPDGDAGLRANRGGALGRVRRLLRRRGPRPHERRRRPAAHHRGRRLAPRAARAAKRSVDEACEGAPSIENVSWCAAPATRQRGRHERGPGPLVARARRRARIRTARPRPWSPRTCSSCSTPPARRRSPKGIKHTTGGYLTQVVFTHGPCSTSSRTPTSTGARPTSAGSPATPTSSTDRSPTAPRPSCTRGRPTSRPGTAGGRSSSSTRSRPSTCAPTAIRTFMKWGAEYPPRHDLSSLRLLGIRRRADQPRGVDLVLGAHRRRPEPGRRHLVADRDRRHHDRPAARGHDPQAGQRDLAAAGHRRRGRRRRRRARSTGGGGYVTLTQPWPAMLRGI